MQLTLYSDYSLRVLVYLGLQPERLATISDIAKAYGISRNHLVKVVHHLGTLGWITTTRGRGGGMALALPADQINIGAVVRQTEPNFDLVECFDMQRNTCPIAPVCALKGALAQAQRAFLSVLDDYTLADVLGNRAELLTLLPMPKAC
jgi:Rrf2 family nitric oxide-sensitive transcriptional repressor